MKVNGGIGTVFTVKLPGTDRPGILSVVREKRSITGDEGTSDSVGGRQRT